MKHAPPLRPQAAASPDTPLLRDSRVVAGLSALLLFSMLLQMRAITFLLAAAALASLLWRPNRLRFSRYATLCVAGYGALALLFGLAAIYTPFEKAGVGEFYKFLAGFSMGLLALAWLERKHIRPMLWGLLSVSAAIALLSLDGAVYGPLWAAYEALAHLLGAEGELVDQLAEGARISGVYANPNVTASIFALASLMGLYLLHTRAGRREALAASLLLGVNAMVFLLSLSRGAILCFGLALLVWLLVAGKGERLELFIRMVVSAASSLAVSLAVMPCVTAVSPRADLLALLTGLPIFVVDALLTHRLASWLKGRRVLLAAAGGIFAAAVAVFVVLAVRLTGPYTYSAGESLVRALPLEPGTYTVTARVRGQDPYVRIYNETPAQAMVGETVEYYAGPLSGAAFTVGENDTGHTYFILAGTAGTTLEGVALSDGTVLPLRYRLLPSSLADRIQGGLFGGSSTTLRLRFMKDAWTVFAMSPLLGHGLASTEGLYCSVQPFFYQSKYVHNHMLQVMADMGLLGLAAFLAFIGGALWLLICRLRKGADPLAALLVACWTMMVAHAMLEVTFSMRGYQCFAYPLLLLPVILYGESPFRGRQAVQRGGALLAAALALYLTVFGGLLLSQYVVEQEAERFRTGDVEEFLDKMQSMIRRDVFTGDTYRMMYVQAGMDSGNPARHAVMAEYAARLRATGTYENCGALVKRYYLGTGQYETAFAASREALRNMLAHPDAWNDQIRDYYEEYLPYLGAGRVNYVVDGTLALRAMLEEYQRTHWDTPELTGESRRWLDAVADAVSQGLEGGACYTALLDVAHSLSDDVTDYGN